MFRAVIILIIFTQALFAGNENTIAVLDFACSGIAANECKTLTDKVRTEFVKCNQFVVIERAMMNDILHEQTFQQSGCTDAQCAVQAGRLLNVRSVVTGLFSKIGPSLFISMRLVDVETGEIIQSKDLQWTSSIDKFYSDGIPTAVKSMTIDYNSLMLKMNYLVNNDRFDAAISLADSVQQTGKLPNNVMEKRGIAKYYKQANMEFDTSKYDSINAFLLSKNDVAISALNDLKTVEKGPVNDTTAIWIYAVLLSRYSAKDRSKAEAILKFIIEAGSLNYRYMAAISLGRIMNSCQNDSAKNCYMKAISWCPQLFEAHFWLAVFYRSKGDIESAIKELKKVENIMGNQGSYKLEFENTTFTIEKLRLTLGNYLLDLGRYEEAYKCHSLADKAEYVHIYNTWCIRAYDLSDSGKFRSAIAVLTRAISFSPYDFKAYHHRYNCYDTLREYQKAIEDVSQCMLLDDRKEPDKLANYYRVRANLNRKAGLSLQAIQDFQEYMNRSISDLKEVCYYDVGDLYMDLKDYGNALLYYKKFICYFPNTPSSESLRKELISKGFIVNCEQ